MARPWGETGSPTYKMLIALTASGRNRPGYIWRRVWGVARYMRPGSRAGRGWQAPRPECGFT
jgi:hypothetical protein